MILGTLLFGLGVLGPQASRDFATVNVTLVDTLGSPLGDLKCVFTLTNRKDRKIVFKSTRSVFENIPYGDYDLLVLPESGIGFDPGQREVHVDRKEVSAVVGLPLIMIDIPHRRDVTGRVFGLRRGGSRKAKIVALYFDLEKETRIDAQGTFKFKDVPFGDYTLTILRNGQTCDAERVRIVSERETITIELSSTNPCK
jgi:hypothetical protein